MTEQMRMFGDLYTGWKKKEDERALYDSSSCEWATPQWLFDELDAEFHFTLDPCSTDENAKCRKHYTVADNGLTKDWSGETVFCNPPYGRGVADWVRKCYLHATGGGYCSDADSGQDRHGMVSRVHLRKGGGSVPERTREVRRKQMERAVPQYGGCVQR